MATQDVAPGKCSGMAHMFRSEKNRQTGMTLIEVLVATLILSGGLLGAPWLSSMPSNTLTAQ